MLCCKKLMAVGAVTLAGLGLIGFSKSRSYVQTGWNKVTSTISEQVSPEFEIERIRGEIAKLDHDMEKNKSKLAEEIVAVEQLRTQVKAISEKLDKEKVRLTSRLKDVDDSAPMLVKKQLSKDYEAYKMAERERNSLNDLLEAKEKSLLVARSQFAARTSLKQELLAKVAALEAELKLVRLKEQQNQLHFDDSRLGEIKASLADVERRVKVLATKQTLDGQFGDPTVEKVSTAEDELLREAREKLGDTPKDQASK